MMGATAPARELRIEDEMPRRTSVVACPEVDEAEDLVCLFAFTDVTEDLTVGILRQEGQDARLAAAAFG